AQRLHLPGQVVQADGRAPGLAGAGLGPDLEQAEVVVVVGPWCLEEGGAREAHDDLEPQGFLVEADGALDVADVEHGVVQTLDGHGDLLAKRKVYPAGDIPARPTSDVVAQAQGREVLLDPVGGEPQALLEGVVGLPPGALTSAWVVAEQALDPAGARGHPLLVGDALDLA